MTFPPWFRLLNVVSESVFLFICWNNSCNFPFWLVFFANRLLLCTHRVHPQWREARAGHWHRMPRLWKVVWHIVCIDQHLRSKLLRGTACCALPDENRMNVTAAPRPNMYTATLKHRSAQRTLGGEKNPHILHILQITHISHIATISKRAYPLR